MISTENKVIKHDSQKENLFPSAFTIDVEDGVSIAMLDAFGIESKQTDRVVVNTRKILKLLKKYNTKATFFILGKVAEDFPFLVKEISDDNHELGVHGYNHILFFHMKPEQALEELTSAKKLIEDISGKEVTGHRAPAFSVNPNTAWAFDVIAESGFKYDSSIMPIESGLYGWPNFPKEIVPIKTSKGSELIIAPLSVASIFGKDIPFSGGGYLRLFPFQFVNSLFTSNGQKRSNILYIHPYELDATRYPDYYFDALKKQSFLKQLKMRSNWLNRKNTLHKLEKLLISYSFTTLENVIQQATFSQRMGNEILIDTKDGLIV